MLTLPIKKNNVLKFFGNFLQKYISHVIKQLGGVPTMLWIVRIPMVLSKPLT